MMNSEWTFQLESENLAFLWSFCSEKPPFTDGDAEPTPSKTINDLLQTDFSQIAPECPHSPNIASNPTDCPPPRPLCDLLLNPHSNASDIEKIKQVAKNLISHADSPAQYGAAGALYYAAIAHALVYLRKKITELTCPQLAENMNRFIQMSCLPPPLNDLFALARDICRSKTPLRQSSPDAPERPERKDQK